jgi:hypothetical protein
MYGFVDWAGYLSPASMAGLTPSFTCGCGFVRQLLAIRAEWLSSAPINNDNPEGCRQLANAT